MSNPKNLFYNLGFKIVVAFFVASLVFVAAIYYGIINP